MTSQIIPHYIILLLTVIVFVAGEEAATSKSSAQRGIKKMGVKTKIYGGKELAPPPDTLAVTAEVWFDLKISNYYEKGKHFRERITVACFGLLSPVLCENFVSLFKGYQKGELHLSYRGTKVKSIIRDYMIVLGDVRTRFSDSVNVTRIYGSKEDFTISHNHAGWLGWADFGPDMIGSEFYIILRPTRWLDGKHTIFGKILKGMDGLKTVSLEETGEDNKPLRPVVVENVGVIRVKKPYILTAQEFNTDGDIVRKT
ncbi:hypothetical protein BsWGS_05498 [Bradybaena similaris]